MEDSELISLIRGGDIQVFEEIIQKYQGQITGYLFRLTGNSETSKDLAQDTFISAYKHIVQDHAGISLRPWLYKIATNNAWGYHRHNKKISFVPFDDSMEAPSPKSESDEIERRLLMEKISLKLPLEQRTCMMLYFVEGINCRDIAEIVGASEEAVRKRIARGSKKFQEAYRREVSI